MSDPLIFPPVNNTCEPVTLPSALTLNLLEDINPPADVSVALSIFQYGDASISPPFNNALEAVTSPLLLTLKLDDDITYPDDES